MQSVCVIGLGYIGLPTAAMLASRGKKVIGVDLNRHVVETVNRGHVHFVEPDLEVVVRTAINNGALRATTSPESADAFLIAVPTPFKGDHEPDLAYVKAAAESLAPVLKKGDLVILESTSPVGTTERMVEWMSAKRPDLRFPGGVSTTDIHVAYCPERVLPGQVVRELVQNDRVIGGLSLECSQRAVTLYRSFVEGKMLISNARTAEMCKLTENAFRDVNIAFANELSLICDRLGVDTWELIRLANHHPRVNILQPGAGVGGHCIAVDPWFIVDSAPEESRLIRTAREVNMRKPQWVLERIESACRQILSCRPGSTASDLRVAVLGLAFKPDVDDLRESPALHIAQQLAETTRLQLLIVEPYVQALPKGLDRHQLVELDAALAADIVVALVRHTRFKGFVSRCAASQIVIDAVDLGDRHSAEA